MNLGKVELHLHLDGSLDLPTAYELAKSRNVIEDTMTFEELQIECLYLVIIQV